MPYIRGIIYYFLLSTGHSDGSLPSDLENGDNKKDNNGRNHELILMLIRPTKDKDYHFPS
jgi:hypothetical protein